MKFSGFHSFPQENQRIEPIAKVFLVKSYEIVLF